MKQVGETMSHPLRIYKKTEVVFDQVYPALNNFPNAEKYTLCAEIKQAFLNLMKNILLGNKVESKRQHYQEEADGYLQFCKILIDFSHRQEYINHNFHEDVKMKLAEIGRMLSGWIKST